MWRTAAVRHRDALRARSWGHTALATAALVSLSACSPSDIRLEHTALSIPELTGIEAARDRAARTEAAAAQRAEILAQNASSCPQCADALAKVSQDSSTRLDAIGGVWDPWQADTPDNAEDVPPLTQAPVTVEGFTSWLAQTARRDLAIAADPQQTSAADSRAFAGVALGRYQSALQLADAYGISLDSDSQGVTDLADRLEQIAGNGSRAALVSWGLDSRTLADAPLLASADLTQDAEAVAQSVEFSDAVSTWDCVAQSLPAAQLVSGSVADASMLADRLLARVDSYLAAGVSDTRSLRCTIDSSSATAIASALVGADVRALSSDDAQIRLVGAAEALADLDTWVPRSADIGALGPFTSN